MLSKTKANKADRVEIAETVLTEIQAQKAPQPGLTNLAISKINI